MSILFVNYEWIEEHLLCCVNCCIVMDTLKRTVWSPWRSKLYVFSYTCSPHKKKRTIVSKFSRSGETISRYFNLVLRAVIRLHGVLLSHLEPVFGNFMDDKWKVFKVCA